MIAARGKIRVGIVVDHVSDIEPSAVLSTKGVASSRIPRGLGESRASGSRPESEDR